MRAYGKTLADLTVHEYKEVHRLEKVGEYIKIVNADWDFERNGDIFKVSDNNAGVYWKDYPKNRGVSNPANKSGCWYHLLCEYVVLEGYKPSENGEPQKSEPEFKVGQLVQIRDWEEMEKKYGLDRDGDIAQFPCFSTRMKPLCGKFAEIASVIGDEVELRVFNTDNKTAWSYRTYMIKPIEEKEKQ